MIVLSMEILLSSSRLCSRSMRNYKDQRAEGTQHAEDGDARRREESGGRAVSGRGGHGERGVGPVHRGEERHPGAVAALHQRPARGRDRQLRRPGLRRHADGRGAVPVGREAGQRVHAVRGVGGAVFQVPVGPARGPPGGPRWLLLRAQDVERAAGGRGGGAGGGQRGGAAADDGHARGGEPRHGLPGQHHRALGAHRQVLRRRPPRRRRLLQEVRGRDSGSSGLARVDAAPGRARGVRVLDEQQRRVRPAVRRAGGVRVGVPGPRAAAGEGRGRAVHAALHHVVLPGAVPGHAAVRVAVHQQGAVLRAGPGGGPGRRVRGEGRGDGEPPAAVRAPRGQRPERVVGLVGLRGRLPRPVLDEGEEVLAGVRRGGGRVAGVAGGAGRGVHGGPRGRRRERRAQDGAGGAGRAGEPRGRHHLAHPGDQQRAVPRKVGEQRRSEGDLRWLQGDDRAARLPDTRYGDRRVPEQPRRLLARRKDQHHRLQGHVQGSGVRVPGGGGRAVRGGRIQGVQTHRPRAVRGEQRRVLEGDEARQELLRLRGVGVAQRMRVPAGVQGRRHHLRGRGRVRRGAGLLLPALLLPEHLGRTPLRVQGRRHGLRQGPGHLRGQERVGVVLVDGRGARALVHRRGRSRRVRLLQVQAQELHGFGGRSDHVAVHASGKQQRREPAAEGGGRGSLARQVMASSVLPSQSLWLLLGLIPSVRSTSTFFGFTLLYMTQVTCRIYLTGGRYCISCLLLL